MKAKISAYIQECRKISVCADIWTKKGMSSSYLDVTGHFFSQKDQRKHCVTLAVRRMPISHTAYNIRQIIDQVLMEWDISGSKISAVLTDNGSNMIAAFKLHFCPVEDDNEEDMASDIEVDEDEYDSLEGDHALAFSSYMRVSCFAHGLQLVVRKFDTTAPFNDCLKKIHNLVSRVNQSTLATEKLISRCGKKLVRDCPTRWSSTFLDVEWLLLVKAHLSSVLKELEWDNWAREWKCLEIIKSLLQPFAQFTSLISGEEFTTLSSVIPAIMDINIHLEEVS